MIKSFRSYLVKLSPTVNFIIPHNFFFFFNQWGMRKYS